MSSAMISSNSRASMDSADTQSLSTLTTFLRDVPPQLTVLLAELGPYITSLRKLAEVASWRSNYADSWLLLSIWWATCLLSEFTLRYLLLFVVTALYMFLSARPTVKSRPPVTEQSLQATVIDLSVIEALLPTVPHPDPVPLSVIARLLVILYPFSLVVNYFVSFKVLAGLFGTVLFTWRSRWAVNVRDAVWRSAWFRRGLTRFWALMSGQPSRPITLSTASLLQSPETARSIRFLITILENQRWWVGLDWTAALLPGERPSWCSLSLEPVTPPSVFILPPPTIAFIGDGRGGLIKRTASWTWDEDEWKVSVRKEQGLKRIEKELPALKEDLTPHANRVGKAKQKVYETGQKLKSHRDTDSKDTDEFEGDATAATEPDSSLQGVDPDDKVTDNDGWIYGDNKWTTFSQSGGLGKYTRYRKWTRMALLTELVEPASATEVHNHVAEQQEAFVSAQKVGQPADDSSSTQSRSNTRRSLDEQPDADDDGELTGIRKRLKAVIRKSTGSG